MKKIIYLFAIVLTVFSSCNPLEDVNNIIDALPEEPNIGAFDYTLQDTDYDALGLNFGNFSSEADAKTMIPGILNTAYSLYGEGSSVNVTYKLYSPKFDEKSLEVYTVTQADYTAQGLRFPNFSRFSHITDFLDKKYPTPANRLLVSLTYDYYSGSVLTLNNGFLNVNGEWQMATGFTNDEYKIMGEGFPNFSNEDEALQKIPVFLNDKFKFDGKVAGDIEAIMYKLYVSGSTKSFIANFIFNGTSWSQYTNVVEKTIQFVNDGTTWVPDNTIRYTLVDSDYTYISTTFSAVAGFEEPSSSAGQYKNFDRRSGNAAYWSDEMLLTVMNSLLDNVVDPSAAEGQQYVLIFDIYNGSSGTEDLKVIKTNGSWVVN